MEMKQESPHDISDLMEKQSKAGILPMSYLLVGEKR